MVKLLDCTTRDGGHCINWNYSDEYIFNLMSDIKLKGINFYEIGYRNYYNKEGKGAFYYCTPDLLKKFYDIKDDLKLGIMVDTKRYEESDFINGSKDSIDFVRIATHPDKIKETLNIAETLNNRNYNVMIQLMDISNLSEEHYQILNDWQYKDILKTIYIADTYGIINTDNLEKIFNKIKELGFKNIGFHAHNQTKQALVNSIKVIELGASVVDIVQDKTGINGGNLLYGDLIKSFNANNKAFA